MTLESLSSEFHLLAWVYTPPLHTHTQRMYIIKSESRNICKYGILLPLFNSYLTSLILVYSFLHRDLTHRSYLNSKYFLKVYISDTILNVKLHLLTVDTQHRSNSVHWHYFLYKLLSLVMTWLTEVFCSFFQLFLCKWSCHL